MQNSSFAVLELVVVAAVSEARWSVILLDEQKRGIRKSVCGATGAIKW